MEENLQDKTGLRKIYRKSWPFDNLFGSSRFELTPAQRGIWNDLLDLAKISRVDPGLIAAAKGTPYSYEWLASLLNCSNDLFAEALQVLRDTKRIEENGDGIRIVKWGHYQTEYDRQKPYREAKKEKVKGISKPNKNILPDWIDKKIWESFLEMRRKIKAGPTEHAKNLLIKEIEKLRDAGNDPNEVIKQSIMNSYKGVFPLKGGQGGKARGIPGNRPAGAFDDIETE